MIFALKEIYPHFNVVSVVMEQELRQQYPQFIPLLDNIAMFPMTKFEITVKLADDLMVSLDYFPEELS